MDLTTQAKNVSQCLQQNGLTIPLYIHYLLTMTRTMNDSSRGARDSLAEQAVSVCEDLYHFLPSQSRVVSWVAGVAKKVLCARVVELTQPQHGLQFNASNATSKYLEGSFVVMCRAGLKALSPALPGPLRPGPRQGLARAFSGLGPGSRFGKPKARASSPGLITN